jgi:hypothetical protein
MWVMQTHDGCNSPATGGLQPFLSHNFDISHVPTLSLRGEKSVENAIFRYGTDGNFVYLCGTYDKIFCVNYPNILV